MNRLRNRPTSPPGFTLIELIVVFVIVGILAAILLSAVVAARGRARRVACLSNLRQIGVALQHYYAVNGVFPSAEYADSFIGAYSVSRNKFSPFSQLLPFLDQQQLYDQIPFDPIAPEPAAARVPLAVFHCPSDVSYADEGGTNYRANMGPGPYLWAIRPPHYIAESYPSEGPGAFQLMDFLSESAFRDGVSNTVGVSEKIKGDRADGSFSFRGDYLLPGIFGTPFPEGKELRDRCRHLQGGSTVPDGSEGGSSWFTTGFPFTWYNHVTTPNDPDIPDCAVQIPHLPHLRPGGIFTARSYHPGGVNCVMMDGSGHFVADEIDLNVWQALGSRDGGEVVDWDQREL